MKRKPRNLMEAVLMAKPGPPMARHKVWLLVDETGLPYLSTVSWLRKDAAAVPRERGVRVVVATLTFPARPSRKKRTP